MQHRPPNPPPPEPRQTPPAASGAKPPPPPPASVEAAAARDHGRPLAGWRLRAHTIVFEADTPAGRLFDVRLLWLIVASVAVVMADCVASIHARWGPVFTILAWGFTALFTLAYLLRLACVRRPARYARSPFGIIDLLSIARKTDLGRLIASVMMLLGWGSLAVPTGIVSAEFTAQRLPHLVPTTRSCHVCPSEGHQPHSQFCRDCGAPLPPYGQG